jgi:hypothetical protein
MIPTVLGHEKAMSPETAWARVEAWIMERPGRPETAAWQFRGQFTHFRSRSSKRSPV